MDITGGGTAAPEKARGGRLPAAARNSRPYLERRANYRYPIDLPLQHEIGRQGTGVRTGQGRVVNISSRGILMEYDAPFSPGQSIRLRIEWPARLNDLVPLALHLEGRTVRVKGNRAAVRIVRSEFRTRPLYQAAGATSGAR